MSSTSSERAAELQAAVAQALSGYGPATTARGDRISQLELAHDLVIEALDDSEES